MIAFISFYITGCVMTTIMMLCLFTSNRVSKPVTNVFRNGGLNVLALLALNIIT